MALPSPRLLLLDLDGTIADSIPFFYAIHCEVFREAGLEPPPLDVHRAAMSQPGSPMDRLFPADFPDRAGWFERLYRERYAGWLVRYERDVPPLAGACEALGELAGRGFGLALVTSSMGELSFLERWGIRRRFATIVSREHVRQLKPHPEPLLLALRQVGLAPGHALHVGDSPLDVAAGLAAGVPTVGVLTGAGSEPALRAAGAAEILGSLAELPRFLGALPGATTTEASPTR